MFGQGVKRTSIFGIGAFRIVVACALTAAHCDAAGDTDSPGLPTSISNEVAADDLPESSPEASQDTIFDTVQGSTSTRIVALARWADSFFDDPAYADEEANARVSLEQAVRFYRNLNAEFSTRVSATVVLPNMNNRLRLSFEGDDEQYAEDFEVNEEENLADATQESIDNPSLRLQYLFSRHRDFDLRMSGGIRFSEEALYAGPRLKLNSLIGWGWTARFTQRVYWYTTDNVKSKTEVRFDHLLGENNLFRQSFRTDWDKELHPVDGFRNSATTSITQPLKKTAAFRYAWHSVYYTRPEPGWTSTSLSIGYRQSVLREWFIVEATPFVTWEEQYNWNPKPGINLSFNIIFENK